MLNKIMVSLIILQSILMYLLFYNNKLSPPQVHIPKNLPIKFSPLPKEDPIPELISTINTQNSYIKNLNGFVKMTSWERNFKISVSGSIFMSKNKKFRMKLNSVFSEELDLGSNDEIFWYWSKRDKIPGLYWAKHEDYHITRLKTPFSPVWIMESLGLHEISTKNVEIAEDNEKIMIIRKDVNGSGREILVTTIVSKEKEQIDKIITTDLNGNILVVSEITHRKNGIPTRILYNWFEENRSMTLEFSNIQVNCDLNKDCWTPPNIKYQVDMGKN